MRKINAEFVTIIPESAKNADGIFLWSGGSRFLNYSNDKLSSTI